MDPPSKKSTLPRASGLPRPSRLPVPQSVFEPPRPTVPFRYKGGAPVTEPLAARGDASRSINYGQTSCKVSDSHILEKRVSQEDKDRLNETGKGDELFKAIGEPTKDNQARRRPRPSLSDRTIETLSQIPPSPSPRRRRSSFFPTESPANTPSRPTSSMSRSRPATSFGQRPPIPPMPAMAPRATSPVKRPDGTASTNNTPTRRAVSSYVPKSVPRSSSKATETLDASPSKKSGPNDNASMPTATTKTTTKVPPKTLGASKTYAPRSSKPRPMVGDAFIKPVAETTKRRDNGGKRDPSSKSTDSALSDGTRSLASPTSYASSRTSDTSNGAIAAQIPENTTPSKSSVALREAIAKAKADRRKAADIGGAKPRALDIEPMMNDSGLLRKRIDMARKDGRLNIAAMNLNDFPREVLTMYDFDTMNTSDGEWYESVDVRRLNAAENELQNIDELFPDQSAEELRSEHDETKGTIFGGLENMDLHGNLLQNVPRGLRQLEYLTTLNLSKNRLTNNSVDTISQIKSLKELRLAENALEGTLPDSFYKLKDLEVLDIHGNAISELPESLQELIHLRVLDLARNRIRSFPFRAFGGLPLTDLNIGRNRIAGTLLPLGFSGFPSMSSFDVCGNALTSICDDDTICMPELQSLSVGENRLTSLPDLAECTNLTTLSANNNNITAIPDGLTSLKKLRNVDLTGNNIKKLDDRLGMMESLTTLTIANNPLRERRFLTMATDNLKQELRNRLLLQDQEQPEDSPDVSLDPESHSMAVTAASPPGWLLKSGGVLDRSSTSLHDINASDLESLDTQAIRSLVAHHNLLTNIPACINIVGSHLTTLDISHNRMSGSLYINERLDLPKLRDLNLASNTINSIAPVITYLSAPHLQSLNVSYNRLTALPILRNAYPALTTLLASDNSIIELPVESVRGLHVCDISRNDIGHLEPGLGLLETEGLRMLGVEGNRFRVPRRDVVMKGTGAVLAWLRDKIPE